MKNNCLYCGIIYLIDYLMFCRLEGYMKSNTKKIILVSLLLFGLTGCQEKITEVNSNYADNCEHKAQLLMDQKDRKIYTYCLDDVTIKINNK